jgi:hypothetical protein
MLLRRFKKDVMFFKKKFGIIDLLNKSLVFSHKNQPVLIITLYYIETNVIIGM